jgi:hypothetical protein
LPFSFGALLCAPLVVPPPPPPLSSSPPQALTPNTSAAAASAAHRVRLDIFVGLLLVIVRKVS